MTLGTTIVNQNTIMPIRSSQSLMLGFTRSASGRTKRYTRRPTYEKPKHLKINMAICPILYWDKLFFIFLWPKASFSSPALEPMTSGPGVTQLEQTIIELYYWIEILSLFKSKTFILTDLNFQPLQPNIEFHLNHGPSSIRNSGDEDVQLFISWLARSVSKSA